MNPFVANPEWGLWIVGYFFLGGIAAGCYFIAALIELLGKPQDQALARLGYRIAFPLVLVCGVFLTIDLDRPERFWHMLLQSEVVDRAFEEGWPWSLTGWGLMFQAPMLKVWSPMSIGAWALFLFGAFSAVSFWASVWPAGRIARILNWRWLRWPWRIAGSGVGFFIASYTGVLLAATNQPIWSQTNWLGPLFLASATSTAVATLTILGWNRTPETTKAALAVAHRFAVHLEALIFVFFLASVFVAVVPMFRTPPGWVLLGGAFGLGIAVPLWMQGHAEQRRAWLMVEAAAILAGGFLLRYAIVMLPPAIVDIGAAPPPSFTAFDGTIQQLLFVLMCGIVIFAVLERINRAVPPSQRFSVWRRGAILGLVMFAVWLTADLSRKEPAGASWALSPEEGRERGGGAGASTLNRPEPIPPRSKIYEE